MIIAFVLLVVLTLIGIFATRTAQIDLQTAYNEIPYKQNFYIAEGGLNREAAELGRGSYPVTNVFSPNTLATQASTSLPGSEHKVLGKSYDFTATYVGPFAAPAGFSAIHFSRYDYSCGSLGRRDGFVRASSHRFSAFQDRPQGRIGKEIERNEQYDKESLDLQSDDTFCSFLSQASLRRENKVLSGKTAP